MALDAGHSDKRMRLRYAGTCRHCGAALPAGGDAVYERDLGTVRCVDCPGAGREADADVAGASARREYERRKQNREARIRTAHPKLGGLILALSDDPQSTRAWKRGAIGEELLAEWLNGLPEDTRVLHDRRIRGTRANIDHVVVSPAGVWVIDAKRYKDQRPTLHFEGGLVRPRVESLRVGGRDRTKLVAGVCAQVGDVTAALADAKVPVTGVLCLVDALWPLIGGSFAVDGVDVLWPRLLVKRIAQSASRGVDVTAVHARLGAAFPAAG